VVGLGVALLLWTVMSVHGALPAGWLEILLAYSCSSS
jgi:hypothetical protein